MDERFRKIKPSSVACYNFTDGDGAESTVTAIIVPIAISNKGEKILISWSCNRGIYCYNKSCRYARGE